MQLLFRISLLLSLLICSCNDRTDHDTHGHTEQEIGERAKESPIAPPPPPPVRSESKSDESIQQELDNIKNATRQLVLENIKQPKPGVIIDSSFDEEIERLECPDTAFYEFNESLTLLYPNASEQTGKFDGKIFCLSTLKHDNTHIIYRRSEGGHTDDVIELVLVNSGTSYHLPLYYHFGKEGYNIQIESTLEQRQIKRKITELIGWPLENKQPISETIQLFKINDDNTITLEETVTENYHFDAYLE